MVKLSAKRGGIVSKNMGLREALGISEQGYKQTKGVTSWTYFRFEIFILPISELMGNIYIQAHLLAWDE